MHLGWEKPWGPSSQLELKTFKSRRGLVKGVSWLLTNFSTFQCIIRGTKYALFFVGLKRTSISAFSGRMGTIPLFFFTFYKMATTIGSKAVLQPTAEKKKLLCHQIPLLIHHQTSMFHIIDKKKDLNMLIMSPDSIASIFWHWNLIILYWRTKELKRFSCFLRVFNS